MHVLTSLPPGPEVTQLRHVLNVNKGMTGPVVLGLMYAAGEFSTAVWLYFAMHGSYGVSWVVKDKLYPDPLWQRPTTLGSTTFTFLTLSLYWTPAVLLIRADMKPSELILVVAFVGYIFGFFLHHVADAQKHYTLAQGSGLITDGLFARTRNPNYLGEMMMYSSFALLAVTSPFWWLPWVINLVVWAVVFVPNWVAKDRSLSRYPGWEEYRRQTGILFPRLFPKDE